MTRVHGIGAVLLGLAAIAVAGAAVLLLRPDGDPGPEPAPVRIERTTGPTRSYDEDVAAPGRADRDRQETLTARSPDPVAEDVSALAPKQVSGRVRDRDTGEPVTAFQVWVLQPGEGHPLTRLDGEVPTLFKRGSGVFRLDQDEGLYDVVVTAPGYHPVAHTGVEVPPRTHKPPLFELSRGAGIAGVVVGHDGMPLKGVPLFLDAKWIQDGYEAPPATTTRSGPDGRFVFSPLGPGEYAISALELDNDTDRVRAIRVRDEVVEVVVPVAARHQLQVAVKNADGRPVGEALVELRGEGRLASASTTGAGLAVLDHLLDGEYTLSVTHFGFEAAEEPVTLHGGTGYTVRWITLEPRPSPPR